MSTYKVENRTTQDEDEFETYSELIEYKEQHPDDRLVLYELCRDNETEINID